MPNPSRGAKSRVAARLSTWRSSKGWPRAAAMDRMMTAQTSCVPQTTMHRAIIRSSSVTCGKVSSAWLALTAFTQREMVSLNIYQGIKPQRRKTAIPMPWGACAPRDSRNSQNTPILNAVCIIAQRYPSRVLPYRVCTSRRIRAVMTRPCTVRAEETGGAGKVPAFIAACPQRCWG